MSTVPTVYFIDDSATMREVIKIAFRRENINVVAHHDASAALGEIEQARPDVVITDVIMPGKDGYEVCQHIKNHPALKGLTIPRTGRPGLLGPTVTRSLVICGESGFATTPAGKRGAMLRAYDKKTGEDRGAVYMPAPQTGCPMTYMLGGRQYIVLAIGGPGYPAELMAFRLPQG